MASVLISIVGAIEEMGCGGRGCPSCPYDVAGLQERSCELSLPNTPAGLARELAEALGVDAEELGRLDELGHSTDRGTFLEAGELALVTAAIEALLARLESQGRGMPDRILNLRQRLRAGHALLHTAILHHKAVRMTG